MTMTLFLKCSWIPSDRLNSRTCLSHYVTLCKWTEEYVLNNACFYFFVLWVAAVNKLCLAFWISNWFHYKPSWIINFLMWYCKLPTFFSLVMFPTKLGNWKCLTQERKCKDVIQKSREMNIWLFLLLGADHKNGPQYGDYNLHFCIKINTLEKDWV